MDIGTRILVLLKEQGITRHEFARRLQVNYSTANGYILNRRLPDCEMLFRIADTLNSSTDYLIGRTNLKYYKDLDYSPKESLLISNFRALTPDMQDTLIHISKSMYQTRYQPDSIWKKP